MSIRAMTIVAAAISLVLGAVRIADAVFPTWGFDFPGILVLGLAFIALIAAFATAPLRLREVGPRAFIPVVVLGFGIWLMLATGPIAGQWLREAWLKQDLASTEVVFRQAAMAGESSITDRTTLPSAARAMCRRTHIQRDTLGRVVGRCDVNRNLSYAFDPEGVTADGARGWNAREVLAPNWYRLQRW